MAWRFKVHHSQNLYLGSRKGTITFRRWYGFCDVFIFTKLLLSRYVKPYFVDSKKNCKCFQNVWGNINESLELYMWEVRNRFGSTVRHCWDARNGCVGVQWEGMSGEPMGALCGAKCSSKQLIGVQTLYRNHNYNRRSVHALNVRRPLVAFVSGYYFMRRVSNQMQNVAHRLSARAQLCGCGVVKWSGRGEEAFPQYLSWAVYSNAIVLSTSWEKIR